MPTPPTAQKRLFRARDTNRADARQPMAYKAIWKAPTVPDSAAPPLRRSNMKKGMAVNPTATEKSSRKAAKYMRWCAWKKRRAVASMDRLPSASRLPPLSGP